jgi:hypothetical protein
MPEFAGRLVFQPRRFSHRRRHGPTWAGKNDMNDPVQSGEVTGDAPVVENSSLKLMTPAPDDRLALWLNEFYGKPVTITRREVLRHRDLSRVERLHIAEGLPETLIYKQVLPPWEIEQDLHERVLIPSSSNSAQLYMSMHYGQITAMFLEDLGTCSLFDNATSEIAVRLGKELAKMHRSYSYRTDELVSVHVLPTLFPIDYEDFAGKLCDRLTEWGLITGQQVKDLKLLANVVAAKLAGEPISLVHGDLYAENVILRANRLFIIDWSWFTILGVPIMDLATLASDHFKNGSLRQFKDDVIDAYCYESGRDVKDVVAILPMAEALSRLFFLHWLVERRSRGIMGTTVGPVDDLIPKILNELSSRLSVLPV